MRLDENFLGSLLHWLGSAILLILYGFEKFPKLGKKAIAIFRKKKTDPDLWIDSSDGLEKFAAKNETMYYFYGSLRIMDARRFGDQLLFKLNQLRKTPIQECTLVIDLRQCDYISSASFAGFIRVAQQVSIENGVKMKIIYPKRHGLMFSQLSHLANGESLVLLEQEPDLY